MSVSGDAFEGVIIRLARAKCWEVGSDAECGGPEVFFLVFTGDGLGNFEDEERKILKNDRSLLLTYSRCCFKPGKQRDSFETYRGD